MEISAILPPLGSGGFVGSALEREKRPRDILSYELNQTPSIQDPVADGIAAEIDRDRLSQAGRPPGMLLTRPTVLVLPPRLGPLYGQYYDSRQRIALYDEVIDHHLTRRVEGFFYQLLAVHQTNLTFMRGRTTRQGGKGTALVVRSPNGAAIAITRQAAHHNCLPSLVAYRDPLSTPLRFFSGSSLDDLMNTTVEVPTEINETDSLVDKILRPRAVQLINQVAQGALDPMAATRIFASTQLRLARDLQPTLFEHDCRRAVLERHVAHLSALEEELQGCAIFEKWLGLSVDESSESGRHLRPTFQRLQSRVIQHVQKVESELVQKVNAVRQEIFRRVKRVNGNRAPNHFHLVFDSILTQQMFTLQDQSTTRRLLKNHYTVVPRPHSRVVILQPGNRPLSGWESTERLIRRHLPDIVALARILRQDFEGLRQRDFERQRVIIRRLREQCGWAESAVNDWLHAVDSDLANVRIEDVEAGTQPFTSKLLDNLGRLFGSNRDVLEPPAFWRTPA